MLYCTIGIHGISVPMLLVLSYKRKQRRRTLSPFDPASPPEVVFAMDTHRELQLVPANLGTFSTDDFAHKLRVQPFEPISPE